MTRCYQSIKQKRLNKLCPYDLHLTRCCVRKKYIYAVKTKSQTRLQYIETVRNSPDVIDNLVNELWNSISTVAIAMNAN